MPKTISIGTQDFAVFRENDYLSWIIHHKVVILAESHIIATFIVNDIIKFTLK